MSLVFLWVSAALVYPPMTKYELFDPGLGGREGDVGQYVRMYRGVPLEQITRPFRYRVFTPTLARLVPQVPAPMLRFMDVDDDKRVKFAFGIANMLGLAACGLLLVRLCTALGMLTLDGVLAAFLFYTSFPVVNFGGTPMADAWGYAFLLLGLVSAVRGSFAGLFVASLAGMFAKETTALLVPIVLLLPGGARHKAKNLGALLPGLVAYVVFRFALYPGGYGHPSDPATSVENLLWRLQHGPYLLWILFDGGTAFGLLWPFAWLGLRALGAEPRHPLRRLVWMVPAILLTPFVIGSNVGRIWFYAFPFMIPLSVVGLRRMLPSWESAEKPASA